MNPSSLLHYALLAGWSVAQFDLAMQHDASLPYIHTALLAGWSWHETQELVALRQDVVGGTTPPTTPMSNTMACAPTLRSVKEAA